MLLTDADRPGCPPHNVFCCRLDHTCHCVIVHVPLEELGETVDLARRLKGIVARQHNRGILKPRQAGTVKAFAVGEVATPGVVGQTCPL